MNKIEYENLRKRMRQAFNTEFSRYYLHLLIDDNFNIRISAYIVQIAQGRGWANPLPGGTFFYRVAVIKDGKVIEEYPLNVSALSNSVAVVKKTSYKTIDLMLALAVKHNLNYNSISITADRWLPYYPLKYHPYITERKDYPDWWRD